MFSSWTGQRSPFSLGRDRQNLLVLVRSWPEPTGFDLDENEPKQLTSSLRIGEIKVDNNEPALIAA